MPGVEYVVVVLIWLLTGLVTAAIFVHRARRRDPLWYLVGILLGPLFVPIAIDRGRAKPERLEVIDRDRAAAPVDRGLKVLVGVDGSAESDRALRAVTTALSGSIHQLVLVTVVSQDLVGEDLARERDRAHQVLVERARQLPEELPASSLEIVTGHPADALLTVADTRDVDVLVVGRRGHGLSERLLGSVAENLAYRSPRAVLLGSLPQRM